MWNQESRNDGQLSWLLFQANEHVENSVPPPTRSTVPGVSLSVAPRRDILPGVPIKQRWSLHAHIFLHFFFTFLLICPQPHSLFMCNSGDVARGLHCPHCGLPRRNPYPHILLFLIRTFNSKFNIPVPDLFSIILTFAKQPKCPGSPFHGQLALFLPPQLQSEGNHRRVENSWRNQQFRDSSYVI